MKKKVIAYLHTHWDREWYREFEVFRLRLIRVFDEVLHQLENGQIPCFYFDGQTSAIEDYLELNPDKESLVKKLIKQKKLFIGPFYTLVDEFLCGEIPFRKNLELGLKFAKSLGCEDFIGYFADTFGHSKGIPSILKEFGIDKAMLWRGCPSEIPSEFLFQDVKTINLIQGYFHDVLALDLPIEKKAEIVGDTLDKIAKKSGNVLLLPLGADHLGLVANVVEQIRQINKLLPGYEIELSSPFKYFELVKDAFKFKWDDELRDSSQTFILPGCYSARMKLKQYNSKCTYMLELADRFQRFAQKKYKSKSYDVMIDYAYRLLLQNLAHDGICGCSTDFVHQENEMRYEKVLQIARAIIDEIKFEIGDKSLIINLSSKSFCGVLKFESSKVLPSSSTQLVSSRLGFEADLLNDTLRIPVTEDYKKIYTYLTEIECKEPSKLLSKPNNLYCKIFYPLDLKISDTKLENSQIAIMVKDSIVTVVDKHSGEVYRDFISIVDQKDLGDCYNFAPKTDTDDINGVLVSSKILRDGKLQSSILLTYQIGKTKLDLQVSLNKGSKLLNFRAVWNNKTKNHLLQIQFNLKKPVSTTISDSLGVLVERKFDPSYDLKTSLPKEKGIEASTNFAPIEKYLWAQNFEIVTKGLSEYEVKNNSIRLTLLRSIGVISNPKNPARSTPAGPPIQVLGAQQLGQNEAEFSIGFGPVENWIDSAIEVFPYVIC